MKIKTGKYLILVTLFLLGAASIAAAQQYEKKQLDKDYWRSLKDGLNYDESPQSDSYNKRWSDKFDPDKKKHKRDGKGGFGKYSKNKMSDRPGESSGSGSGNEGNINTRDLPEERQDTPDPVYINPPKGTGMGIIGWLLIALLILVLVFVIYKIIVDNARRSDKKVDNNFDESEPGYEHLDHVELPKSELELRLEAALKEGNYREAVRIWFIFIIKGLKENNWITWERKKTNTSYLYEMRDKPQYRLFSKSVTLFELIWYGKHEITQEEYEQLEPLFKKMIATTTQKGNE